MISRSAGGSGMMLRRMARDHSVCNRRDLHRPIRIGNKSGLDDSMLDVVSGQFQRMFAG